MYSEDDDISYERRLPMKRFFIGISYLFFLCFIITFLFFTKNHFEGNLEDHSSRNLLLTGFNSFNNICVDLWYALVDKRYLYIWRNNHSDWVWSIHIIQFNFSLWFLWNFILLWFYFHHVFTDLYSDTFFERMVFNRSNNYDVYWNLW